MPPGLVDLGDRYQQPEKPDPLPRLSEMVDWEGFRAILEKVHQKRRPVREYIVSKRSISPFSALSTSEQTGRSG